MCLGVPMQIVEIRGFQARCEAKGIVRQVSLLMLQHEPPQVGDHVLVHIGYAIQKLAPEEAAETWRFLDAVLAADENAPPAGAPDA